MSSKDDLELTYSPSKRVKLRKKVKSETGKVNTVLRLLYLYGIMTNLSCDYFSRFYREPLLTNVG